MKIRYATKGEYISYSENGSVIVFERGLSLDCKAFQRGEDVTLNLYAGHNGAPTFDPGDWYLAQIKIPAKSFRLWEDGSDLGLGFRRVIKTEEPLNMENVVLTLWAKEAE